MVANLVQQFEKELLNDRFGDVRVGDTVEFTYAFIDGGKERSQKVEGLVIARKHGKGMNGTVTLRTTLDGYGLERIFPVHSPMIKGVKRMARYKVRRAKLYYIRGRTGKAARLKRAA